MLIGGHIDSVPNGGWLDGALNVLAGVEVMRRLAEEGEPAATVRLVNWADEEGARFGRSLFGSSAAAGSMADQDELRARKDADGIALPDVARRARRRPRQGARCATQLENAAAYLELHIEQGPVLESHRPAARRRPRHLRRRAPPDHVPRPGRARRLDADGRAARRARRRREARARDPRDREAAWAAARSARWAASSRSPGIVTSVVETAECLLDQRHLDAATLASMLDEAKSASERIAAGRGHRGRVGADLEHRADPVRRRADRARRRVDSRGRRHVAPPPERTAARRSRGLPRGCARP